MNILFVISSIRPAGPVFVIRGICEELLRKGQCVTLCSIDSESNQKNTVEEFVDMGVTVNELDSRSFKNTLREFTDFIKKNEFSVCHVHCLRSLLYARIFIGAIPLVYTSHHIPTKDWLQEKGRLFGALYAVLEISLVLSLKNLVTISGQMYNFYDKLGKKSVLIRNGLCVTSNNNEVGNPRLVWIGRLIERKNPLELLRAIIVCGFENLYKVSIYGEGLMRGELEEYVTRNGLNEYVTIHGHVEKPYTKIDASTIYVSTSNAEGMPLSVIEAGMIGPKCMLLSDIEPHREVAKEVEEVELYKLGDVDALAKLIFKAYALPSQSKSYKKKFKRKFSQKKMGERYLEYYEAIRTK